MTHLLTLVAGRSSGTRIHHSIASTAINQETLTQNTFAGCAGFFRDALTGEIIHRRHDFNALQTKLFEPEARRQTRCRRCHTSLSGAAAHPISEIRDLMNAVNEVQANSAKKPLLAVSKHGKAVPFITLAFDFPG